MNPLTPQMIGQVWDLGPFLYIVAALLLLMLGEVAARLARVRNGLGMAIGVAITLAGAAAAVVHSLFLWLALDREGPKAHHQMFFSSGPLNPSGIPAWSKGALAIDHFSLLIGIVVCLILAAASLLMLTHMQKRNLYRAEVFPLLLGSASGMMLLGMSRDLLVTFIAIEIVSLPLYVLCGLNENSTISRESSLKYFLLGAFASGFLIYGAALVYGATGHLNYAAFDFMGRNLEQISPFLILGIALVGAGLAFKLALVPFHAWVPDVYQGAPTPVTAFMAAGVKLAVFSAAIRLVYEGLGQLDADYWRTGLVVFAVLSMCIGNLFALHQMSAKRLLAYSAITHTGYIAVGLAAASEAAMQSILVYLVAYCVASIGAFTLIDYLAPADQDDLYLDEMHELSRRAPLSAAALTVLVLSMAGFPLTLGFIGKLAVLLEAWNSGLNALVIIAVLNSVVGVYYYLRFVLAMYMQPKLPGTVELKIKRISGTYVLPVLVTTGLTLLLGMMPGALLSWVAACKLGL